VKYYSMVVALLFAALTGTTPNVLAAGGAAASDPPRQTPPPPQPTCAPGYILNSLGQCILLNRPYRRPIIIQQTPAAEPEDTAPLAADWEGCRKTKLNQLNARQRGDADRANNLEEWLWKNCRSYSSELRDLEQDGM
jgi:hypothetical protein